MRRTSAVDVETPVEVAAGVRSSARSALCTCRARITEAGSEEMGPRVGGAGSGISGIMVALLVIGRGGGVVSLGEEEVDVGSA